MFFSCICLFVLGASFCHFSLPLGVGGVGGCGM